MFIRALKERLQTTRPLPSLFNAYFWCPLMQQSLKMSRCFTIPFRIGGGMSLCCCLSQPRALVRVLEVLAANRVDWVLLGKGSNILF